jgi:hypothetical protein
MTQEWEVVEVEVASGAYRASEAELRPMLLHQLCFDCRKAKTKQNEYLQDPNSCGILQHGIININSNIMSQIGFVSCRVNFRKSTLTGSVWPWLNGHWHGPQPSKASAREQTA